MSRYIDAEKLKANYLWWHKDERKIIDDIVDSQPTADVLENVKGEWIVESVDLFHGEEVGESYICSVCGKDAFDKFDFCPNCGADMRPITALSKNAEIYSNLKRGEA